VLFYANQRGAYVVNTPTPDASASTLHSNVQNAVGVKERKNEMSHYDCKDCGEHLGVSAAYCSSCQGRLSEKLSKRTGIKPEGCKEALLEHNGDYDEALAFLRKAFPTADVLLTPEELYEDWREDKQHFFDSLGASLLAAGFNIDKYNQSIKKAFLAGAEYGRINHND